MPFDNSGNFVRTRGRTTWQDDAAAKVKIKADLHDASDNDIADGLSNAICRDGQSTIVADIPWSGKKITALGSGVNPSDAVNFGQLSAVPNINGYPAKETPVDADEMLIANSQSAPAWQRAKITLLALKTYIYTSLHLFLHALDPKSVLVDADEFNIADSAATPTAFVQKRHTWLALQTMIGIAPGQRLAKTQGATPVADLDLAVESGFYVNDNAAVNTPVAATHGYMKVTAYDANSILQEWSSLGAAVAPLVPRSFVRRRNTTWGAWRETTSVDALQKTVDGVIVDAGYTITPRVTPDAPAGGAYTPSPVGGNTRQVNSVGTPWTFNAPTYTGNYSMVVLINNAAISGAVTFAGFSKVTGGAHPTALGKWSLVYITKVGAVKTAYVEATP